MTIATLFSGIGAPEISYPDCLFGCEIDKHARRTYKENHDTTLYHDVKNFSAIQYRGAYDCLVWGFPCQDYSIQGKRLGLRGLRGSLFYEGARIIQESQPPAFIAENVRGLLSSRKGKDFDTIFNILTQTLGYHVKYKVLNSKDYGVPQSRPRVFIIGFINKVHADRFKFPDPIPLKFKVKDILEPNPDPDLIISRAWEKHVPKARDGTIAIDPDIAVCQLARQYANWQGTLIRVGVKMDRVQTSTSARVYSTRGIAPTLITTSGKDQWYPVNESDYTKLRKLSVRECARLQGFPDTFMFPVSDAQAYKQLGNTMTAPVIAMLLKEVENALSL